MNVSAESFETAVIERSRELPVIVDFWAPWCGPCHALAPVLEQEVERRGGAVELVKVNVDDSPELASRYAVSGIPSVKAFSDGAVVNQFVGALPPASSAASSTRSWTKPHDLADTPINRLAGRPTPALRRERLRESRGEAVPLPAARRCDFAVPGLVPGALADLGSDAVPVCSDGHDCDGCREASVVGLIGHSASWLESPTRRSGAAVNEVHRWTASGSRDRYSVAARR